MFTLLPPHLGILAQLSHLTSSSLLEMLLASLGCLHLFSGQLSVDWMLYNSLGKHVWITPSDHSSPSRSRYSGAILALNYSSVKSIIAKYCICTLNSACGKSAFFGCSGHLPPLLPWPIPPPFWCIWCISHLFWHILLYYRCPIWARRSVGSMVSTCPHPPSPTQATDRLFSILGSQNFIYLLRGSIWRFATGFRGG